jgi:hypothetical protein
MLAVAVSPHGLTAIRLNEAALSQELCTVGLLQPHTLVEYQWQNIGLCREDSSTTNAQATSCRDFAKTRFTCIFNNFARHYPNHYFPNQNSHLA